MTIDNLSVLSFNILAEQFIDYDNPTQYYPNIPIDDLKEKNRLPKIFAFLKKTNPDIMMLQEVNPRVQKMLKLNLSKTHILMPLARHKSEEPQLPSDIYGNLIALRKSLFTSMRQIIFNVPRIGSAFALVTCKYNGRPLLIVNIHLDASEVTEINRVIEIKTLLSIIKPYMNQSIIISGDFNTNNTDTHRYFSKFKSIVNKEDALGSYLNEASMIDWIYTKNIRNISGDVLKPARSNNATPLRKFGSDHYPVIGEIEI